MVLVQCNVHNGKTMKTALITGIRGQDGAYLAQLLLQKGYKVIGTDRKSRESSSWRLKEAAIENQIEFTTMDLLDLSNIMQVLEKVKPDEIYNLAAQSYVGASFDQAILTYDVNAMGTIRLLETIRKVNPEIKYYQASSSEMFGKVQAIPQSETTAFHPRSPYGVSKVSSHWMTVNYRESYNMFTCSGILFNHESPFRGIDFVTRKITDAVARIELGKQEKVTLGNLDAKRDWGYARDYVEAMWLMLQAETPEDYVVATGVTRTIKEFVEKAFSVVHVDLEWEGEGVDKKGRDVKTGNIVVDISKDYFRPAEVDLVVGDASKAKENLGWSAKKDLNDVITMMVEADLRRVKEQS